MNRKIDFTEVLERAEAWNEKNYDRRSLVRDLSYGVNDDLTIQPIPPEGGDNGRAQALFRGDVRVSAPDLPRQQTIYLTDQARRQFADRMKAPPVSWLYNLDRCDPELRAHIFNHQISRQSPDRQILFRLREHAPNEPAEARAVLSDVYAIVDHFQYLTLLRDALEYDGVDPDRDLEIERFTIGDTMTLYAVFPMDLDSNLPTHGRPANGHDLGHDSNGGLPHGGIRRGFKATNSEIGTGSGWIMPAVWRKVCANGMRALVPEGEGFNIRHVGTQAARMVELADAVTRAFKMSAHMAEDFVATQAVKFRRETLGDLLNKWRYEYRLPAGIVEDWNEKFTGRASSTLWEHINHLTMTARDVQDPDRQDELEKVASQLVTANIPDTYLDIS